MPSWSESFVKKGFCLAVILMFFLLLLLTMTTTKHVDLRFQTSPSPKIKLRNNPKAISKSDYDNYNNLNRTTEETPTLNSEVRLNLEYVLRPESTPISKELLITETAPNSKTAPNSEYAPTSISSGSLEDVQNVSEIQQQRVRHIKDVCLKYNISSTVNVEKIELVHSKEDNIAYLAIPKIGSTFLKQMFTVLKNGVQSKEKIVNKMRMDIHKQAANLKSMFSPSRVNNTLVMLPSRNPYTRLFSAYIDKVFLPMHYSLAKVVAKTENTSKCGYINASFVSFLNYALRPNDSLILLDHYESPYKAMKGLMCQLDNFVLIKQESFSNDVEYVLKTANVNKEKYVAIYDMLHDHRADASVPGIIKTLYEKGLNLPRKCYPWSLIARRAWKSFQIQGFLSDELDFPEEEFKSLKTNVDLYEDVDHVIETVLNYIKKIPLTSAESKAQRRKALLNAYKSVDDSLMERIHQVYSMDFEMFQYDLDLMSSV